MLAVAVLALSGSSAVAQESVAKRTWVSDSGDDGSPCTRAKPCATFARAIAMTALRGEVDVASSGEYGTFKVTKGITIRSRGHHAGIQAEGSGAAGEIGVMVDCGPRDCRVVLDGLDLNGEGSSRAQTGIFIAHAGRVHIKNTNISDFAGGGIVVSDTLRVVVEDTTVAETIYPAGPTAGLLLTKGVIATVRRCTFIDGQTGIRVLADPDNPTTVSVSDTSITDNDTGIATGYGGATVRLNHNEITGNGTGLLIDKKSSSYKKGDKFVSFGNNNISGNGSDGERPSTDALR